MSDPGQIDPLLFAIRDALVRIRDRADQGGRRITTAMSACEDIEFIATTAISLIDVWPEILEPVEGARG